MLHPTPLMVPLCCSNSYLLPSYIVYCCQDIYKSNKADGNVFIVTLITAVEDNQLVRSKHLSKTQQKHQVWEDCECKQKFAYYILYMCSYAFHTRQRKVLSGNEWAAWLRLMKTAFDEGTIREYWDKSIEPEKWFDPAFQDFIDEEIIKQNNPSMKQHYSLIILCFALNSSYSSFLFLIQFLCCYTPC